jgi:hypothetical protein
MHLMAARIGAGQNAIAFPLNIAYFYKPKACYENNGLCALWEGVKPPILVTHRGFEGLP